MKTQDDNYIKISQIIISQMIMLRNETEKSVKKMILKLF